MTVSDGKLRNTTCWGSLTVAERSAEFSDIVSGIILVGCLLQSVLDDRSATLTESDRVRQDQDRQRKKHRSEANQLQQRHSGGLAKRAVHEEMSQHVGCGRERLQLGDGLKPVRQQRDRKVKTTDDRQQGNDPAGSYASLLDHYGERREEQPEGKKCEQHENHYRDTQRYGRPMQIQPEDHAAEAKRHDREDERVGHREQGHRDDTADRPKRRQQQAIERARDEP